MNSEKGLVIFVPNGFFQADRERNYGGEFISAVSHEIKTTLSVISGVLDVLKKEYLTN